MYYIFKAALTASIAECLAPHPIHFRRCYRQLLMNGVSWTSLKTSAMSDYTTFNTDRLKLYHRVEEEYQEGSLLLDHA